MKRRRLLTATALVVVGLVTLGVGAAVVAARKSRTRARSSPARAAAAAGPRTVSIACRSASLDGSLPAQVYLPTGYSAAGRRYPVIYFLHGLPGGPGSYTENAFVASALVAVHERAIVVAPQGARGTDSDREYLDWNPTENWPAAIAHDLTACIDARYHTIADRYGRALMGLSAGGYGAMNIGLRNTQKFGAVESWSGYFVATDPSGYHVLDLGSAQANDAATVPRGPALRQTLQSWPTMIGFYVGLQDTRFLTMNEQFDASLRQSGIGHTFATYPGGHSTTLWRTQAPSWLRMALSYMAAGQKRTHGHD
jgi:enterochelin esterase-like enzyme